MASIKKRPSGVWRARYRDEAGKEHAKHFHRRADAQRWLDDQTAGLVRGDWVDPSVGRITFGAWWDQWADAQEWVTGTRETADQVKASLTFADVPIRAVNENHVRQWMKTLRMPGPRRRGPLAASTRRTRFNYVRMCFAAAVRARIIRLDPTAGIAPPKVSRSDVTIPTPQDVRRAIEAASPGFRAYVGVCAFAGLRLGEAAGLQVGDVDFMRRTITVERQIQGAVNATATECAPKYESGRVVYVPEEVIHMLNEHLAEVEPLGEDGYLFHQRGYVYNRNSAGKVWREVREQVGLDDYTLHDLRHFYASGLIAAGCDVVTVQHALGHSTPSITLDIYSHLWPRAEDRTRNAAAALVSAVFADESADSADSVRTAGTE